MKLVVVILMMMTPLMVFAQAGGSEGTGGGSGCMAGFTRTAFEIAQWLKQNGNQLSPAIQSKDFLSAVDPRTIKETKADLQFNGNPVDAYYDGTFILIRCDRLKTNLHEDRLRVVAHEIFRKMRLEGDAYEISRQMFTEDRGVLGELKTTSKVAASAIDGVVQIGDDLFVATQSWRAAVPATLNTEAASFAGGKSEAEAEERAYDACYTKFSFCRLEKTGELSSEGMAPQDVPGRPDVQYRGHASWQTSVRGSNSVTLFKKLSSCRKSEIRSANQQLAKSMPEKLVGYVIGPNAVSPQSVRKVPPYSMEYQQSAVDAAGGCTVIAKAVKIEM